MIDKIKDISVEIINAIETLNQNNLKLDSFEINCKELKQSFHKDDIRDAPYFIGLFKSLKKIENKPTIYWFSFKKDEQDYRELFSKFKSFKEKNPTRNTPAIFKYPKDTNISYLGKSKNCLWGRLILHLGYHQDKKSQGLLLSEWTNKTNLKLNFNYVVFEKEMSELISFYEYKLSQKIKPLIGKHK